MARLSAAASVTRLLASLPKKLHVAAQTVVVEITDLPKETRHWGEYDSDLHVARIDKNQYTHDRALETVVHEVLHVLWSCWHLNEDAKEEDAIKALAPALICLFRDNPEFLQWFVKAVKHG